MSNTRAQDAFTELTFARPSPRPGDRILVGRRLVEFRCRGRRAGHVLAVIYHVPAGDLFVSTADSLHATAQQRSYLKERNRQFTADLGLDEDRSPGKAPWNPSPRLVGVDETFADDPAPINCRCGQWPDLARGAIDWSHDLVRDGAEPIVVGVSRTGLHGPRDTLYLFD